MYCLSQKLFVFHKNWRNNQRGQEPIRALFVYCKVGHAVDLIRTDFPLRMLKQNQQSSPTKTPFLAAWPLAAE